MVVDASRRFDELVPALDGDGSLVVWERAIEPVALQPWLARPDWSLNVVDDLAAAVGTWSCTASDRRAASTDRAAIAQLLAAANGLAGPPSVNVALRLRIRACPASTHPPGGLAWCRDLGASLPDGGLAKALVGAIVGCMETARAGGSDLVLEQIGLVQAKDPTAEVRTLTPRLHADLPNGPQSSAIVSIHEPQCSGRGGTLLLPTVRMADLPARWIGATDLEQFVDPSAMVLLASGDLAIYDGSLDPDGVPRRTRGIPHLSLDRAGAASRLILLMRHLRPWSQKV